jgi:hypothetical protein
VARAAAGVSATGSEVAAEVFAAAEVGAAKKGALTLTGWRAV